MWYSRFTMSQCTLIFKHVVLWNFIVFKTTVNHTNCQLTTLCTYC